MEATDSAPTPGRKFLIVPVRGEVSEMQVPDILSAEVTAIQDVVLGYMEGVPVPGSSAYMIVNEEGRLNGLPPNPRASALAGQPIVGPVVLTGPSDKEGESGSFTLVDWATLAASHGIR